VITFVSVASLSLQRRYLVYSAVHVVLANIVCLVFTNLFDTSAIGKVY